MLSSSVVTGTYHTVRSPTQISMMWVRLHRASFLANLFACLESVPFSKLWSQFIAWSQWTKFFFSSSLNKILIPSGTSERSRLSSGTSCRHLEKIPGRLGWSRFRHPRDAACLRTHLRLSTPFSRLTSRSISLRWCHPYWQCHLQLTSVTT